MDQFSDPEQSAVSATSQPSLNRCQAVDSVRRSTLAIAECCSDCVRGFCARAVRLLVGLYLIVNPKPMSSPFYEEELVHHENGRSSCLKHVLIQKEVPNCPARHMARHELWSFSYGSAVPNKNHAFLMESDGPSRMTPAAHARPVILQLTHSVRLMPNRLILPPAPLRYSTLSGFTTSNSWKKRPIPLI